MSTDWYLAQIKPNALGVAERNLKRQGFQTLMPKLRETRGGTKFVERFVPLFPGYIFVGASAQSCDVGVIRSTRGVVQIVRSAGKVTPIPNVLIETLTARCDQAGVYAPAVELNTGDLVRVNSGPFAAYFGKIHELSAKGRVWVLLDVMGRGLLTELQSQDVLPVK